MVAGKVIQRALAALAAGQRGGATDNLASALGCVAEACGADVALALQQVDPVTALPLACVPAALPPESTFSPALFAEAMASAQCVYRNTRHALSALPSFLQGSAAIIPFWGKGGLCGAVILVKHDGAPFAPEQQAILDAQALPGLFGALAALDVAELRAEELRARFDAMVHTLLHGLVFMDESGAEAWVNDAAAALLGVPEGAVEPHLVARAMAAMQMRADNRDEIRARLAEVLRAPDAELRDVRWIYPNAVYCVSSTPTSVRGIRGRLWVFEDVTAQHAARRELEEKNRALDAASREAEAASRAKSEFLAAMSHEIRTPMNGVLGMAALLADTELTPDQREFVDTLRTSGESLLTLINDILDLSKIESGHFELDVGPFDLRACVEDSLALFVPKAAERGLELGALFAEDLPELVIGDATRVRQILVNLIGNAVKFTRAGEVIVEVSLSLSPSLAERGPTHIQVRDTGMGIPESRMHRLFQSFSQADASIAREYGGTGLGLAICKRLSALLGGEIRAESALGVGSTFHVTLPLPPAPATALATAAAAGPRREARPPIPAPPELAGKRALVVDDNRSSRAILARHLEACGMAVVTAASAAEALALLDRGARFDLALLDAVMPGEGGRDLAAAILARPDRHAGALILLTTVGSAQQGPEAASPNIAASLRKPIHRRALREALREAQSSTAPPERPQDPAPPRPRPAARAASDDVALPGRRPLRVLLAEDNPVNQKVAQRMLARLGCHPDVVSDGQAAVEAAARVAYDLIFMDVQMPRMDGLAATREIRAQGAARGPQPRIVALTANALIGDREMCLASGMDEFISKPVRLDELAAALERATEGAPPVPPPAAQADAAPVSGPAPASTETGDADGPPFDPQIWARLCDLFDGSSAALARVLDGFQRDAAAHVTSMRAALEGGDWPALEYSAHTLKGSCMLLGAMRLSRQCGHLERAAQRCGQAELAEAADTLAAVVAEHQAVDHELAARRAALGLPAPPLTPPAPSAPSAADAPDV